ncbi:hypothetical protein J7J81_02145 [bacterium]|nr:hypothetical protein [bacterium]
MSLFRSEFSQGRRYLSDALQYPSFSRDFKILCWHQVICSLANGMLGLFLPIFFFRSFSHSIYWVIVFYAVGYFLYALFLPFGAMAMSKIGLKKSMIIARFIILFFYFSLLFLQKNIILFSIVAEAILLLFRLFYWIPYHTDFAKFTDGRLRGREVAWLKMLNYLVGVLAPILAGLILSKYNFNFLFLIAIFILAASVIPLFKLTETQEHYSFSFLQTFRVLSKKENRNMFLAYGADGAQGFVGAIIWPIFIFQLLNQKYMDVGSITALVVGGTVVLQIVIGNLTDKARKKSIMEIGSILYSFGWIMRALVMTAYHIFVVGIFQNFTALILRTPFDTLFYEKAADHGSYVDEYTVLREISLSIGRVVTAGFLVFLIYLFGVRISFYLAGLMSLFVNFL